MATVEETFLVDIAHKKDLLRSSTGDYQSIGGKANVLDAIFRRIVTVPGSLIHRPNYGAGLILLQNNVNTLDKRVTFAQNVRVQLDRDPRVEETKDVTILQDTNNPDRFRIRIRVNLVGLGEQTVEEVFE